MLPWLRVLHTWARAQALPEFSRWTGRPRPFSSGSRRLHVAPLEVGGEEHAAGAVLDHARHHHPDPLAPAEVAVLGEDRLDPLHEVGGEALRVGQGREAGHAHELVADEVGHHRVGAQHADVDGDHAALARVDVEELRPPAAQGLAGRALEDEALPDQLVHQQADGAPTGAHEPREVGPGDRLVRPHQAERDPPIDLAGRPARGDLEVPGIDAPHGTSPKPDSYPIAAMLGGPAPESRSPRKAPKTGPKRGLLHLYRRGSIPGGVVPNGGVPMPFKLIVNGKPSTVDVPADMPLLWVLRDVLDLKGAKYGCGIGQCGACTVHLRGVATRSCMTPVSTAVGTEITTIEGLSTDGSHPLQKAWNDLDVPQCGYCQAGQIMTAAAFLKTTPKPTDADIDAAMAGNVCRCATYLRIREAIKKAALTVPKPTRLGMASNR